MRVVGYCRVSTDSRQQASSFASQQRFFREYITHHEDWELGEIYADEGLSGTSTRRREAFNRMIRDARAGKFQLILTKEVSRFSRNILDTVAYTRELKGLGVGVLFLNDGIDTRDPDAELRLSIMGSIAQEESRRTSERVKWGQQRQMERGVVFGHSLLGYRAERGQLTIEPNGAAIVRRIFHAYAIEGKSSSVIARELEAEHIPTTGSHWTAGQIVRILKNEKYAGDLIQKKTYTPNYLTHQKKPNHGAEEKIVLRDHHEPIIDRELWNAAQTQLQARTCRHSTGTSRYYPFSGKIYCGVCGSPFVARNRYRKDGTSLRRWSCSAAARGSCKIGMLLREDTAVAFVRHTLESVLWDRKQLIMDIIHLASEEAPIQQENIQQKRQSAIDAYTSGILTADDLRRTLARYEAETQEQPPVNIEAMREHLFSVLSLEDDTILQSLVERITVHQSRQVEVKLSHWPQIWTFQL